MVIWKVGLYYGSALYFEMGKKCLDYRLNKKEGDEIGEFNLKLEANEWYCEGNNHELCNSSNITREFAETSLNNMLIGKKFEEYIIDIPNNVTTLYFEDNYQIKLFHEENDPRNNFDYIFSLFIPKKIIALKQGFNPKLEIEDGERIKRH